MSIFGPLSSELEQIRQSRLVSGLGFSRFRYESLSTHLGRCLLTRQRHGVCQVWGTSLMRNTPLLGPYSRTMPEVIWWSYGGGLFLVSEAPLPLSRSAGCGPLSSI